ncbi:MAG: UPF0149 family protein [Cyanobacteria bacterium K_DeepCast_35m_m1_288]|nr:UPF0149 family protein [Cyanobacteria bacterium K_DeepCast_35m_m1_288]
MRHFSIRSFYSAVSEALSMLDSDVDPAECHGMLCGMLCSPAGFATEAWLEHLAGYTGGPLEEDVDEALHSLLQNTVLGMDSDEFAFELLLPDDDEPLVIRTDALGGWCRGFLSGFGVTRGATGMSHESQEFLGDLYRISQVDPEETTGEAGEQAFLEIVEYARMGAILLREENRTEPVPDMAHGSVH